MGNNMTQLTNKINFDKATGSISIPGLNNKIKILNPFSLVGVVRETAILSVNTLLDFIKNNFGLATATNPIPFVCNICETGDQGLLYSNPVIGAVAYAPGITVSMGMTDTKFGMFEKLYANNWYLARGTEKVIFICGCNIMGQSIVKGTISSRCSN